MTIFPWGIHFSSNQKSLLKQSQTFSLLFWVVFLSPLYHIQPVAKIPFDQLKKQIVDYIVSIFCYKLNDVFSGENGKRLVQKV